MSQAHDMPSSVASGRYVLGELLGEGGMARVYRAHDNELGVDRAIKLLIHTSRPSVRRRLRNEARAMARLRHPNILGIHDVGKEGELDYIVMDLATRGSLQDRVAAEGPLPMGQAVAIMVKVLSALATAHAAGIVHRDVKPHNVLLDDNDQPVLADFGIAMLAEDDRSTKTGVAMGSLAFMPPEQRLDAAHVGPTADIYASGCTLFAVLTNDNPVDLFLAPEDSPRWAGVPEPLRKAVQTACSPHTSDRYATAKDMADALLEVLDALGADERERALNSRGFFPAPSEALSVRSVQAPPTAPSAHPPTIDRSGQTLAPADTQPTAPPEDRDRRWLAVPLLVFLLSGALCLGWAGTSGTWATNPTGPTTPVPELADAEVPEVVPEPTDDNFDETDDEPDAAAPVPEPLRPEPAPAQPAPDPVAPEPAPQPVPTVGSAIAGSWTGSANGRRVQLELSGGDDALQGTFVTTWSGRSDRAPVRGSFDPTSGAAILEDVDDGLDSGRYELTLTDGRLKGFFVRTAGGKVPLSLYRP